MFTSIEQVFIALLSFTSTLATKFISSNNEAYMNQLTLVKLNPDEYNQDLYHHQFIFSINRCNGNCNNLDDL